ncbi:MFS transporter [Gluconacetobacter asukensis]|nr:MFS transporter [Gluconacetobacter asukensis]
MYTISYADRAALSIAMPALGGEFHLGVVELGWLSSSFLWSYFLLNLPSSIVLDVVGPRLMGTLSVAFWSFAMMIGGAVQGVGQFVVTRVFLGVGESPTFGIGNSVLRIWARPRERGSVSTMLLTGQQAGLAVGTLAGAFMIARYGWRAEFVVLGLVGILWAACWWLVYRSPKQDGAAHGHRPARRRMSLAQVRCLFRNTSFYAIVIPQCMANYFNFLVISWLPVYFIHRFHESTLNSGASSAICYVSAALGAVVLGHVLERMIAPREDRPTWRRFIVFPCMTLGATVGLLPFTNSETTALVIMSVGLAGMIAGSGANTALLTDLLDDGTKIGTTTGITLTFSNIFGLCAPIVTGYIVSGTGNFDIAWFMCAGGLMIAGLTSLFLIRSPIITRWTESPT